MTVEELIEELKTYPFDMQVMLFVPALQRLQPVWYTRENNYADFDKDYYPDDWIENKNCVQII